MRVKDLLALASIEAKPIWQLQDWELNYVNALYDYMEMNEYKKYMAKLGSYAYRLNRDNTIEPPIEVMNKFIKKYPESKAYLLQDPAKTLRLIYYKQLRAEKRQGLCK
jgi:hypothetical protein